MQHKHQGCESISTLITIDGLTGEMIKNKPNNTTKYHKPEKE